MDGWGNVWIGSEWMRLHAFEPPIKRDVLDAPSRIRHSSQHSCAEEQETGIGELEISSIYSMGETSFAN